MSKSLRLILTETCNRNCHKCVNKQYDLNTFHSWKWNMVGKYNEVMISGGEPMLYPKEILAFIRRYRSLEDIQLSTIRAKFYLYTARVVELEVFMNILDNVEGATVTLHNQLDVGAFLDLNQRLLNVGPYTKSLRLSVFSGIHLPDKPYPLWNIMRDRRWIDCPEIPEDDMLVMRDNFER